MNVVPYKHISVLIMPTDYCNMNCVYCFNSRKSNVEKNVMSEETLRKIFEITIPYYSDIVFIWHGGEPLSMGMEFYQKVVELQKSININNSKIKNTIQTNLTLLDKAYAEFLVENDFHIGSSYDGITNELTRHNTERIIGGHQVLKECGGNNGFICVVQNTNIDYLIEDYKNFKSKKINYNLNMYMTSNPEEDTLFVEPNYYIKKMCEFFDYWMYDKKCNIKVSYFETFVKFILQKQKELCCYNSCMGKHIGIHFDGKIYGCNRDFTEDFCFGNVHEYEDVRECFNSQGFNKLLKLAILRRNKCKENCEIYEFCAGGCNSVAYMGGNIAEINEYVCKITIEIYKYIEQQVEYWRNVDKEERINMLNPHFEKYYK